VEVIEESGEVVEIEPVSMRAHANTAGAARSATRDHTKEEKPEAALQKHSSKNSFTTSVFRNGISTAIRTYQQLPDYRTHPVYDLTAKSLRARPHPFAKFDRFEGAHVERGIAEGRI